MNPPTWKSICRLFEWWSHPPERRARDRQSTAAVEHLESRWVPAAICDLTPTLVDGPAQAEPGSRIAVQSAMSNLGDTASPKVQVEYRLSLDENIDSQDILLATVTRPKTGSAGEREWTQSLKLPSNLPAGTYHLGLIVDPANRITETNEANNVLSDSTTIVVSRISLTGRVQYLKHSRPVEIVLLRDSATAIDPTATTWLVIHGRNESAGSLGITELANAIDQYQPGDQVLLLNWEKAAFSGAIGGQGENYIRPVATWAAQALTTYGITGQQLNLVGYSWGADVAAEMAEVIGHVNSILAVDAARDYPGGSYNPEAVGEVDFQAHADQSWAFFAPSNPTFGSGLNSGTAETAIVVLGSDHFGVLSLVTNLVLLPNQNPVGSYFTLAQLLTGVPTPIWSENSYSSLGALDLASGTFDAVLTAASNGSTVQSLKFFDSETEQTVPA